MFRNKASTYAVLSVLEIAKRRLAGETSGIQAGEIAEVYGLPTAYAAKVMSQLARSRILRSDRGPKGGFQLVRDPSEVNFKEIIEAVNGIIDGRADAQQSGAPDEIATGLANVFGECTDAVCEKLESTTVADFVKDHVKA